MKDKHFQNHIICRSLPCIQQLPNAARKQLQSHTNTSQSDLHTHIEPRHSQMRQLHQECPLRVRQPTPHNTSHSQDLP